MDGVRAVGYRKVNGESMSRYGYRAGVAVESLVGGAWPCTASCILDRSVSRIGTSTPSDPTLGRVAESTHARPLRIGIRQGATRSAAYRRPFRFLGDCSGSWNSVFWGSFSRFPVVVLARVSDPPAFSELDGH